ARHRASDAFRQSRFHDEAKKTLEARGEPARGRVLGQQVQKVKRKFIEAQLSEMGMERAQFWGFPNTYTYTKAIGEQIAARSGLKYTIVRPAIVESTLSFPFPGWNEGINTSAPLIFILRQGGLQIPGSDNYLDVIPCDMVAAGLTLALGELLDGTAKPVYQLGSSDTNPCTMRRFFELTGLYKRKYYQRTGKGGPVFGYLQQHFEGAMLDRSQFEGYGPLKIAEKSSKVADFLGKLAQGPARPLLGPAASAIKSFSEQQRKVGAVLEVFVPFTVDFHYVFRTDHVRAANARLSDAERQRIGWAPDAIDWRHWFFDVHMPALERFVFPQIEERLRRPKPAPARHETLTALLDEMATRYDLGVALQRAEQDGLTRLSYRELQGRALACAARLRDHGVGPGSRVMLCGQNHPAWPIAFFGILYAGATVVPLDSNIEADIADNLAIASSALVLLADRHVRSRIGARLVERLPIVDLHEIAEAGEPGEAHVNSSEDVAALIYTSGTTGRPKGVQLSHENLTSLAAALAPLFPLEKGDRVLSVLPLHHTFELTCGLLLPLSRGARIVYLDELNAERLEFGLKEGRITGLIGVPALWEMLERRMMTRVAERGQLFSHVFDFAVELNRSLGKSFGVDAGKLLFGPVHEGLGGHLRYLVSGGAALPERTHHLFAGVGLHLAEGYGLTEASPVLTVASAGPKSRSGHVGKPIPGVEVRIEAPNAEGVGEVIARGPNVMLGYADDEEATKAVIGSDGWLRTGDLGKLDHRGHLTIVGRAKDVIVASNGENVYPDDVEARLGKVEHVAELTVVGVKDGRGGERVACVAVPEDDSSVSRSERHARAQKSLDLALSALPNAMRPALTQLMDTPLPRTTTRKVKRNELVAKLQQRLEAKEAPASGDNTRSLVRAAVGTIARRDPATLHPGMSLRGDLGFDSLMLLELLVALENQVGKTVDADRLNAAVTIADAEAILRDLGEKPRAITTASIEREEDRPIELPPALREAAMHWMGRAQAGFYDKVLRTRVSGRAFLPHNRNVIVAANHASHLDMGLVKYALGSYGEGIVSLAAQDYFFEGNRFRKAYFENFTNLVPMSRNGSLRGALRRAGELLDEGKTLLIFPEGTRSPNGSIQEFKSAVGHLALHHQTDILPVWLGGTYQALPKGGKLIQNRDVQARIGPVLEVKELRRLTAGMTGADAARTVARLSEQAVRALSRGEVFDISRLDVEGAASVVEEEKPTLAPIFRELETRFRAGSVEQPISYYFSLGEERWSVRVDKESCEVREGKINPADCVLKTSPDIFTRIVREAYVPSPAEFMAGTVKSNNIQLLVTFQKVFQLQGQDQ
ncbi:MAG TPA: AMP-binding protein, partial [Polyangiaceae bacterium]|nr:AMP-binding protein [Polyangiaceae bacterium]